MCEILKLLRFLIRTEIPLDHVLIKLHELLHRQDHVRGHHAYVEPRESVEPGHFVGQGNDLYSQGFYALVFIPDLDDDWTAALST